MKSLNFLRVLVHCLSSRRPGPFGGCEFRDNDPGKKVGMILGTRLEFFSVKVSRITITGKEIMTWKMHFIGGFTLGLIW